MNNNNYAISIKTPDNKEYIGCIVVDQAKNNITGEYTPYVSHLKVPLDLKKALLTHKSDPQLSLTCNDINELISYAINEGGVTDDKWDDIGLSFQCLDFSFDPNNMVYHNNKVLDTFEKVYLIIPKDYTSTVPSLKSVLRQGGEATLSRTVANYIVSTTAQSKLIEIVETDDNVYQAIDKKRLTSTILEYAIKKAYIDVNHTYKDLLSPTQIASITAINTLKYIDLDEGLKNQNFPKKLEKTLSFCTEKMSPQEIAKYAVAQMDDAKQIEGIIKTPFRERVVISKSKKLNKDKTISGLPLISALGELQEKTGVLTLAQNKMEGVYYSNCVNGKEAPYLFVTKVELRRAFSGEEFEKLKEQIKFKPILTLESPRIKEDRLDNDQAKLAR